MKKILILGSLDPEGFYKNLLDVKEGIKEIPKAVYFSPEFLIKKEKGVTKRKQFFLRILGATQAISDYGEKLFNFAKDDAELFFYYGPCPKSIEFDYIFVVNEDVYSVQETYYEYEIEPKLSEKIVAYKIKDADEKFESVEEVLSFIKEEFNV